MTELFCLLSILPIFLRYKSCLKEPVTTLPKRLEAYFSILISIKSLQVGCFYLFDAASQLWISS